MKSHLKLSHPHCRIGRGISIFELRKTRSSLFTYALPERAENLLFKSDGETEFKQSIDKAELKRMDHQNSLIQNYLTSFRPQNFSLPRLNPFVSLQQHQWFLMNQQQLWQNHFFCNSTPYNLLPTFPTYPSSLQGAGDGLSLETKENYDRNNNNLNSTRRSLSPPSVSFEDSFKVLPLQPEAEKYHRQILQIASEANRSTPKYEDLHYLGVPYASSLRSFQLFQNLEFNFGTPQKIRPFQHPRILKSEEYERVRQEFSYNGFVSVEENCNQSVASSSSTPFTFFGDSDFPPLEQAADKNFSSQFAAGCVDSMPMFNVNSAISASPLSRQLVKKDSNIDKSTTDGVSLFETTEQI